MFQHYTRYNALHGVNQVWRDLMGSALQRRTVERGVCKIYGGESHTQHLNDPYYPFTIASKGNYNVYIEISRLLKT